MADDSPNDKEYTVLLIEEHSPTNKEYTFLLIVKHIVLLVRNTQSY